MSCCIFCKNKNYVIKVIGGVAKFSAKIKKVRICDSPHRDRFQKIRPERGIQAKSMSCCIFCKNQKFGHQNAMGGRIFCGEIKKSENLWKLTHRSVLKKLAQSAGSRQNQWAVAYLKIGRLNIDESITSVWEKSLASTKKKWVWTCSHTSGFQNLVLVFDFVLVLVPASAFVHALALAHVLDHDLVLAHPSVIDHWQQQINHKHILT